MRLFKQILYVALWLTLWVLISLVLIMAALLALVRGRQEQYFVQKPIFDPGEKRPL